LATELHHISKAGKQSAFDLIFVHGIGGDPITTWTHDPSLQSWLNWLDEDHPDFGVFSIQYESSPSEWLGSESMPIYDRANNLLELLTSNDIGQRPIFFVGHSLGGLLIKKILQNAEDSGVARYRKIFDQTKAVVFIATPHQGSARVPTLNLLRKVFKITELAKELDANNSALRDTYNWYRAKTFATLSFSETLATPSYGLIVDQSSSEPGVANAIAVPISADHFTISKPKSRTDLVYASVRKFLLSSTDGVHHSSSLAYNQTAISEVTTLSNLIKTFDKNFLFRWEQNSFEDEAKNHSVYWPVRLRHPTPIHAAQCFAAAGLQRMGAKVYLFIDDLGEQTYEVSKFRKQLLDWLRMVGGNPEAVQVLTFSEVIATAHNDHGMIADPWTAVRKWLGETDYRLGVILKVSKLIKQNDTSVDLASLSNQRPRRLLTPAMVWTCLSYLNSLAQEQHIITLAGYDEKPLWDVWKAQSIAPAIKVGHLFLPLLNEVDSQHGSAALHMEEPKSYSLDWNSRDDIRTALQTEFNTADWAHYGRLVPWSMKCCVFLPQFVANQEVIVRTAAGDIGLGSSLESFSSSQLSAPLTDELARWLN
jgi:pimeloyl-ACP methyl ester carboxylesterase